MLSTFDKTWFKMNGFKQSNAASCMLEADVDDSNDMISDVFKLQLDCMNRRLNFFNYEKRILKDLDLFVLDNSLQESTVGHVRGHTLENKWKIYNEVKKVGIEHIAVASFSRSTHSGEPFAHALQRNGTDGSKHFAFVDCFDTCTKTNTIKTDLPTGLEKCKKYGINNVIMELDLVSREMDYGMFNAHRVCELLSERIEWIRRNISESSLVFVNIRDFSDSMRHHPARVLFLINYLASFPGNERVFGIMYEDGGKYYSEQLAVWTFCVREELNRCGWNNCHLLANIRDQYGLCNGTLLDCLADGATGTWAGICAEGASMGHASYCVTIMNLIRLGNTSVAKKYKCRELREAARSVTAITTGHPPYPRQPVIGDRSSGIYFGLEPLDQISVQNVKLFNGSAGNLVMTHESSSSNILTRLTEAFGNEPNFNFERAKRMKDVAVKDMEKGRREDYEGEAGLAMLYQMSGGSLTPSMQAAVLKRTSRSSHLEGLINEIRKIWDEWNILDEQQSDKLEFSAFHNAFVAPYFSGWRDNESTRLLEAIQIKKGTNVSWKDFVVHLRWAANQHPETQTADELLTIAFRQRILVEMEERLVEQVETQGFVHYNEVRSDTFYHNYSFNPDLFFRKAQPQVDIHGTGLDLSGTVWDWYHDGRNKNGEVEFTADKKVKWGNGEAQGSWTVDNDVITTTFGSVLHRLKFNKDTGEANLIIPQRNPPSRMIKKADSGFEVSTDETAIVVQEVAVVESGQDEDDFFAALDKMEPSADEAPQVDSGFEVSTEDEIPIVVQEVAVVESGQDEDDFFAALEKMEPSAEVPQVRTTKYKIRVKTGDIHGGGTDSHVYIILCGKTEKTDKLRLEKEHFYQAGDDLFTVEAVDVGNISSIIIGHENNGRNNKAWYLGTVELSIPAQGRNFYFPANRWLDGTQGDNKIEVQLHPQDEKETYETTVKTGKTRNNPEIKEDEVEIAAKTGSDWVDLNPMDKLQDKVIRYEITVKTGDVRGAGTDANVFVCLYGDKGIDTGYIVLGPQDGDRAAIFERDVKDEFKVDAVDVGNIKSIKIGHDNKGGFAGWYLDWVSVKASGYYSMFSADRWLDTREADKKLEIELTPTTVVETDQLVKYDITVKTGDIAGAGTDANVYVCLFGEEGKNTGNIVLHPKDGDRAKIFERNVKDEFTIEAVDIGELKYVRIGHDNKGGFAGWYLDWVSVKSHVFYLTFKADRWLDLKEGNGKLEIDLYPKSEAEEVQSVTFTVGKDAPNRVKSQKINVRQATKRVYSIYVKTGDVRYAGTDAAVHCIIWGANGVTNKIQLDNSKSNKSPFERKQVDLFTLEELDVGNLEKLRIGHDGSGPGAGWYLEDVVVDVAGINRKWKFVAKRWLDSKSGDGKLEVDLKPTKFK